MEQSIKRWEMIEMQVPALSLGRVSFGGPIAQLRNQPDQIIVIKGIEIFPVTSYANSQQTNSLPGLPAADIKKAVLVLYVDGSESIKMIPLVKLIHVNDLAGPFEENSLSFEDLTNVDFDKSYVQFSSASNAAAYVIPFGISYMRLVKNATGMPSSTTTPTGNFLQG